MSASMQPSTAPHSAAATNPPADALTDAEWLRISASLPTEISLGLDAWSERDWNELQSIQDPNEFVRAVVQADEDLSTTATSTATSEHDANAYDVWTKRIARLHILEPDNEEDSVAASVDAANPTDIASSMRSSSPSSQLLRYKLLLAQEESHNVALEDRCSRLTRKLQSVEEELKQLRTEQATIQTKHLQQLTSLSSSCRDSCQSGLLIYENDLLTKQNRELQSNLTICQAQLGKMTNEMEEMKIKYENSSTYPQMQIPSSPSAAATNLPTSAPISSSPFDSTLLQSRTALALSRFTLRHHLELNHLLPYKQHNVTLQTRIDDLENSLDISRELLTFEQDEHRTTRKLLRQLKAEEEALHEVIAHMASQLQKYVASQGMGMRVTYDPAPHNHNHHLASPPLSPDSAGTATLGNDATSKLSSSKSAPPPNATTAAATPTLVTSTTSQSTSTHTTQARSSGGGGGKYATLQPGFAVGTPAQLAQLQQQQQQSKQSHDDLSTATNASATTSSASKSSGGWGLGWMFGSSSKTKQRRAAKAAAAEAAKGEAAKDHTSDTRTAHAQ